MSNSSPEPLITDTIAELIALGAACAVNAEKAFLAHHERLTELGASKEDMIQAVNIALTVKDRSSRGIIETAQALLIGQSGFGSSCSGCSSEGCGDSSCGCGD